MDEVLVQSNDARSGLVKGRCTAVMQGCVLAINISDEI